MDIKVLGPGCAKCKKTEEIVRQAVDEAGVDAKIEKVSDFLEISKFGVMATPSVVVDGKVKCAGKIPKKDEVKGWLK